MQGVTIRAAATVLVLAWVMCVPSLARSAIVAVEVNGQAIAVVDIEQRVRDIHRAKPRTRSSGSEMALSVDDIVDSLVNERLLVQEALDMHLDEGPAFRLKMKAFVRDQSILQLYREEVEGRVQVEEADIAERYTASLGTETAPQDKIPDRMRDRIGKILRKERQKVLADEFVTRLRAQSEVVVNHELLQAVKLPLSRIVPEGSVVVVNGEPVPMAEFMGDLGREYAKAEYMLQRSEDEASRLEWLEGAKERVLDALVTNVLVGHEALKRDYAGQVEFEQAVAVRRHALLLDAFRTQVLLPLAEATDEDLKQFYDDHAELYTRGCQVRLGELRFKEMDLALAAQEELRGGAVFAYLARRLGGRSTPGEGWVSENRLPSVFREALVTLPEGGVSDVLTLGRDLVVLKLRGRRGCTVMPYEEVLPDLRRRVLERKYAMVRERYVQALRNQARIVMHSEVLESLEDAFWKSPPDTTDQLERGEQ
ncbi:peptidylprolyl isomerase [Desulfovibrio ferrophilus]|uniref:Peptidylprolyl cis-trans isomerase n=1 Tax=Desulfovibrio ferrophilus TaxID=241368 RepID=A0A2Z6AVD4_9BACT|nr:peptidylprolyl isomerase [Desulfovibrio ferrophilus]BBD07183.1 peptidylprolyl cis-trans isomerase [Desulfovibrio ferrophilus]